MKFTTLRRVAAATGNRSHPAAGARSGRPMRAGAIVTASALALGLAACGSSSGGSSAGGSSSAGASGGKLTVADVAPFSGADAALGPTYLASCYGATAAINKAGGVLGHTLTCKSVNTRGDPADAVPAVNQMFASTPSLALVIGCTSDEAASVAPVINAHKMAMFCMTGQSEFDHVHYPYFYRLVPPDLEESYAMVAIAQQLHYKRVALAFGNDIGSQTFIQPAISALKKAGITMTTNQTLDLTATTFRSEAEAIIQSHPDAIMTEALGAADPTLFSEIKQLNGGKMIPVIGTSAAISPAFFKSAAAAVGTSAFVSGFHADNLVVESSGPPTRRSPRRCCPSRERCRELPVTSPPISVPRVACTSTTGSTWPPWPCSMSKSTSPGVYGPDIIKIGNGVPGATVCYSFAQCAASLKAGKAIRYEGPGGPTNFDSYHDSTGIFQVDTYTSSGAVKVVGNLTPAQLRALAS